MIKIFSVSILIAAFVLSPFVIDDAFATHFSEDTKWQLVYLTDTNVCSNYDHQVTVKYDILSEKYFGLYEFPNTKYDPLCMNNDKYNMEYEMPKDLDMIILVYSRNLGEVELHNQKMGGIFYHTGSDKSFNNAIIICDCANFYYSDPVWVLTHEMSHFILYFLEYDMHIIEDLVHKYDDKYDQCRNGYDASCESILEKLRVEPMAYSFSVMPPYEPAIGASKLDNEIKISAPLVELGKTVTEWWTAGKISEGDFSNAIGLIAVQNQEIIQDDHNVLYKDGPIDKSITWQDILLADGSTENKEEVMSSVREKLKIEDQIYQKPDLNGLPDWFKSTAQWWVDDEITNEEFVRNIKFLKDSGVIRTHNLE
jgi:hypothetical protein